MKTIIIEKGGDFKETSIKLDSLTDIYKKCGFKSHTDWLFPTSQKARSKNSV